ncbi:MAG: outer membrane protein transport protein [bacterium]
MTALLALLAVPVFCFSVFAQSAPDTPVLTLGLHHGPGSRAMGLGGAYTGVADDFTATYWNPAGLAQIKRIELQGSLLQTGYSNSTRFYMTPLDASSNFTRLNNLGMVFPVPVYQGALSFAIGYNQVVDYGARANFRDDSGVLVDGETQSWNELETGRLGFWNFAGAMDVSPNVSLGLALCYWTGQDELSVSEKYWAGGWLTSDERLISTDLSGWGAIAGGLAKFGRWARMGFTIGTPITYKAQEEWSWASEGESDAGYWDYRIRSPWILRWGFSLSPGRWLLAADIDYKDWTQVEYRSDPSQAWVVIEGDTIAYNRSRANLYIRDTYRPTTGIHFGGEYLIPFYGMRTRLGFGLEPANEKNAPSGADRKILGLGLGVLLDRSVLLDASFMHSWWKRRSDNLTEDITLNNLLLTLSYRF